MRSDLLIGRILRPRGLGGELKMEIYASDPHWLTDFSGELKIDGKAFCVEKFKHENAFGYVKFKGVDSAESAEALRDKDVYAARDALPKLKEGEHFIVDIIGLGVKVRGEILGRIVDVAQYGSADVYTVKTAQGSFSFPALKSLIKNIDVDGGVMELDGDMFDRVVVFN